MGDKIHSIYETDAQTRNYYVSFLDIFSLETFRLFIKNVIAEFVEDLL